MLDKNPGLWHFWLIHDRVPLDLRSSAFCGNSRNAAPHLYLSTRSRLGSVESNINDRCVCSGSWSHLHSRSTSYGRLGKVRSPVTTPGMRGRSSGPHSPPPEYNFEKLPDVSSRRHSGTSSTRRIRTGSIVVESLPSTPSWTPVSIEQPSISLRVDAWECLH